MSRARDLATTLHLYLNGTLTLTFVESQTATIGISHYPLNNPGGVGLLSVDPGTTYGTFIAGAPGWVPQAQELAGSPLSGLGVASLTAAELAPIVTAAEAQWVTAGLTAAQTAQLQGLQFLVTGLTPGMLGEYVPGVIYLDPTADGWGWFVDSTPGKDEEYAPGAGALAALPSSGAAGHVDLLTVVMHEMGHALGLPDWTTGSSNDLMAESLGGRRAAVAQRGRHRCGVCQPALIVRPSCFFQAESPTSAKRATPHAEENRVAHSRTIWESKAFAKKVAQVPGLLAFRIGKLATGPDPLVLWSPSHETALLSSFGLASPSFLAR